MQVLRATISQCRMTKDLQSLMLTLGSEALLLDLQYLRQGAPSLGAQLGGLLQLPKLSKIRYRQREFNMLLKNQDPQRIHRCGDEGVAGLLGV